MSTYRYAKIISSISVLNRHPKETSEAMANSGATCCPTAGIHVVTARDNINENSAYYIDMLALGEKVQRSSSLSHSLSLTTFPASPFRVLLCFCHCPVSIFPSSAYNSKRENEKKKQQLFRNSDAGQLALSRPFLNMNTNHARFIRIEGHILLFL